MIAFQLDTEIKSLSIIDIVQLFAIAIIGGGILDTFLTFIYLPAVANAAKSFEISPAKKEGKIEDQKKSRDISEMFRKMGDYLSEVKMLMRQSQNYEKDLKEFHDQPRPTEDTKRNLHERAKQMMIYYENTPQILAVYANAFEHIMAQLTKLLESTDDAWQNVTTSHPKNEKNIATLEEYIMDGSVLEFLRHLALQYK